MKNHWWKALGVLLIIYSFVAGFLIPLKPGIIKVDPSSAETGDQIVLKVTGYNTEYEKAVGHIRAWLKMDNNTTMESKGVRIKNNRDLEIRFNIPTLLPSDKKVQDFTLIIDSKIVGTTVLPSALFVTQKNVNKQIGVQRWNNDDIESLTGKTGTSFPFLNILAETIRNTFFHVPLWFGMFILFIASVVLSMLYLRKPDSKYDLQSKALTSSGVLFGILGLITGAIWAKHTWGAYWSWDVKQNMTAVALLIYLAYFVLRNSFDDAEKRGKISAVYNIFAFATMIPLLYVIPKLTDSLHPGSGGNLPIGSLDLDSTMRMIFYPAIIGWTLIGVWMAQILYRADRLEEKILED